MGKEVDQDFERIDGLISQKRGLGGPCSWRILMPLTSVANMMLSYCTTLRPWGCYHSVIEEEVQDKHTQN
jgi:hypothetical protein